MENPARQAILDPRNDFIAVGGPQQAEFARAILGGRSGLVLIPGLSSVVWSETGDSHWPMDLIRMDWPQACVRFVLVDATSMATLAHGRVLDLLAMALNCANEFVVLTGLAVGDTQSDHDWSSLRGFQYLLQTLGFSDFELRADHLGRSWTCLVRVRSGVALPEWGHTQPDGATIAAQIDAVADDCLFGWIDDPTRVSNTQYQMLFDGQRLATFVADVPRPDAIAAGRFYARGFRVPFPYDKVKHDHHVISITTDNGKPLAQSIGLLPVDCWGKVESWNGTRLDGWLNARLGSVPQVELWLDGVFYQRVSAQSAHDGRARFSFEFACAPNGNAEMLLDVRLTDSRYRPTGSLWRVMFGSPATPGEDRWSGKLRSLQALAGTALPGIDRLFAATSTAVIIPVFNNADMVRRCIESVLRWTNGPASLIVVDDSSGEKEMDLVLQHYAGYERILIVRNPQNVGYTRSIAIGMHYAAGADVVLLNSDVEVGPRWLDGLRIAAYSDERIGTATAVSDNAGAFSVPELENYCPWPIQWDYEMAARSVLQNAGLRYPAMPTGNGFCMFVKRAMLDRVGGPDSNAFPTGYGEENDLCMRGERLGYRHVIAGNVLIHHKRSASFGDERRIALGANGMQVLRSRYPEYEAAVHALLYSANRHILDYRVRRTYAQIDRHHRIYPPRMRILFVLATDQGEAAAHVAELMSILCDRYEAFVLRWDNFALSLYRFGESGLELECSCALERCREFAPAGWNEYEGAVRPWLAHYGFEVMNIHELGWHSLRLPAMAAGLGIPVVYTCHDFHAVCPTATLRDENNRFCAGRCTQGEGPCRARFDGDQPYPELKHNYIRLWKPQMREALAPCDAFVFANAKLRDVVVENHPWLVDRDLRVIVHADAVQTDPHSATQETLENLKPPSRSDLQRSSMGLQYAQTYRASLQRRASFINVRRVTPPVVVGALDDDLQSSAPLATMLRHAVAMGRLDLIRLDALVEEDVGPPLALIMFAAATAADPQIEKRVERAQQQGVMVLWWDEQPSRLAQALANARTPCLGLLWGADPKNKSDHILECDPGELPVRLALQFVNYLTPLLKPASVPA